MKFDTFNKLIEYLEDNFYTTDFINLHTRPQLVEILKSLYPNSNFKRGMCKERQIKHIEFWLNLHNRKCKKNTKVTCCNLECKNYKDGQCTKETIELSPMYMEDSDGKGYYVQYCTDED